MPVLKSLTFTALPQPGSNPILDRRTRMILLLEEQKRLLADANYKRTVRTWVTKDGQRTQVEKQQSVAPWWRLAPSGEHVFFMRVGWKAIEFEKGKSAVAVPSLEKLPGLIDTLITAIRSGELDEQLAATSKFKQTRKPNKVG